MSAATCQYTGSAMTYALTTTKRFARLSDPKKSTELPSGDRLSEAEELRRSWWLISRCTRDQRGVSWTWPVCQTGGKEGHQRPEVRSQREASAASGREGCILSLGQHCGWFCTLCWSCELVIEESVLQNDDQLSGTECPYNKLWSGNKRVSK